MYGRDEKYIRVLVEKPEGKTPLGRSRHGWENNIRTDLRGIEWGNFSLDSFGSG
jgi:hypothetical protein